MFSEFDTDGSGTVSFHEVRRDGTKDGAQRDRRAGEGFYLQYITYGAAKVRPRLNNNQSPNCNSRLYESSIIYH